jgi:hypothetical protein
LQYLPASLRLLQHSLLLLHFEQQLLQLSPLLVHLLLLCLPLL